MWDMSMFRADVWAQCQFPPSQGDDDDMWAGPFLIQGTGKDGTQPGKVYACDGRMMTVRWLPDEEALEGYRWWMSQTYNDPSLKAGAPIEAVDKISAFGVEIT